MEKESQLPEKIIFILCTVLFGLSYDYTVFFACIILLTSMIFQVVRQREIYVLKGVQCVLLWLMTFSSGLSIVFAVDKGIALLGFFRMLFVPLAILWMLQYKEEHREGMIRLVPYLGTGMVCLCGIAYFVPGLQQFFFNANRLGGLFQYSNTFALYLLLGLVIISFEAGSIRHKSFVMGILFAGILWTGSRSVFVFAIATSLVLLLRKKRDKKAVLAVLCCVVFIIIIGILGKNVGMFDRFTTISLHASTFVGRILYMIDALPVFAKHPLGVGYMGYYYMQPAIQHGVYTVRYVHNDWLQFGLDNGSIYLLAVFILFGLGIFSQRKENLRNVIVLILCGLHMFIDFDLQFMSIWLLVLLCMDWSVARKSLKKIAGVICLEGMAICLYLWLFLANGLQYLGKYGMANRLYPWNSEVKEQLMLQCDSASEAELYADSILKENKYNYAAYNVKAVSALDREEYMSMLEWKRAALDITRYDIEEYQDYILMLKMALEAYANQGDVEQVEKCVHELLSVEDLIDCVKNTTSSLAYQIDEKPQLEISKEYKDYIEQIRGLFEE